MEVLFIIAAIAITIGIGLTKNRNQTVNQAWASVARRLDLSLREASFATSPQLSGFVSGHDVTVDIHKKRAGKGKSAWTRFRLGMSPLGLGLKLKRQGRFSGFSRVFGAKDIQTGDTEFDQNVLVVGRSDALMREYLTPARRRTVLNFLNSFADAVITDDEISVSSRGYERNADDVIQTINAMMLVAEVLSEVRDDANPTQAEPVPVERPAPSTEHGREPRSSHDKKLTAINEPDYSREVAIREAANPGDATASAAAGGIPIAAATDGPDPAQASDSPAIDAFCTAVFAPGTLSFDATRSFKSNFEGKRIRWSGTLESVSPFTVDFDFGSSGGVRAVLTIDPNEAHLTGGREVKAVVGLPVGTIGLDNRIGERVAFTGTLRKVDGFGRKVFVADAELAG